MAKIMHNRVYTNNPDVVRAFLNEREEIDFARIIPLPEKLDCSFERWADDNWGTECGYDARPDEAFSLLRFDSKSRAPLGVYEEICRRFPNAQITFYGSVESCGKYRADFFENQNGEMVLTKVDEILVG